ncbi:hypothetical protein DL93DRAFT_2234278 [Clavulina sp. PMI_390]|nr:hypothetical protein DL93DRAFT_2234278 [Clavulina sp. PMI_390]
MSNAETQTGEAALESDLKAILQARIDWLRENGGAGACPAFWWTKLSEEHRAKVLSLTEPIIPPNILFVLQNRPTTETSPAAPTHLQHDSNSQTEPGRTSGGEGIIPTNPFYVYPIVSEASVAQPPLSMLPSDTIPTGDSLTLDPSGPQDSPIVNDQVAPVAGQEAEAIAPLQRPSNSLGGAAPSLQHTYRLSGIGLADRPHSASPASPDPRAPSTTYKGIEACLLENAKELYQIQQDVRDVLDNQVHYKGREA